MIENPLALSRDPNLPELIQGGMGFLVSGNKLARAVATAGESLDKSVLGTVSGTGLSVVCIERLGRGDEDTMRALQAFPVPKIAQELKDRYWLKKNRFSQSILPPKPEVLINGNQAGKDLLTKLLVFSNYAEVFQAKQGHNKPISINYLEKVQPGRLFELYGAMLAGVDYVTMGAGLPTQTPGILDRFAAGQSASYKINVTGADGYEMTFNPAPIFGENHLLKRPKFLAVVSIHVAAQALVQRSNGEIQGFVVENKFAGGHNAFPRKDVDVDEESDIPIYGPKDEPDLDKFRKLSQPFWLAGGKASPERLREAFDEGASGIQVGSAFALCDESGILDSRKRELRSKGFEGTLVVVPSKRTSPTGYPINIAQLPDSLSNTEVYKDRERQCDYGFLDEYYQTPEGNIRSRCPAEPVETYVANGGKIEKTEGARCLCAGLGATVGMASGLDIVTLGQKLDFLGDLMKSPNDSYTAEDVVRHILQ